MVLTKIQVPPESLQEGSYYVGSILGRYSPMKRQAAYTSTEGNLPKLTLVGVSNAKHVRPQNTRTHTDRERERDKYTLTQHPHAHTDEY